MKKPYSQTLFLFKGWSAEYVDDKIFLCGGSNINQVSDCYDLNIGDGFWNYVSWKQIKKCWVTDKTYLLMLFFPEW